jgi:hypothetical protein
MKTTENASSQKKEIVLLVNTLFFLQCKSTSLARKSKRMLVYQNATNSANNNIPWGYTGSVSRNHRELARPSTLKEIIVSIVRRGDRKQTQRTALTNPISPEKNCHPTATMRKPSFHAPD